MKAANSAAIMFGADMYDTVSPVSFFETFKHKTDCDDSVLVCGCTMGSVTAHLTAASPTLCDAASVNRPPCAIQFRDEKISHIRQRSENSVSHSNFITGDVSLQL